MRPSTCTFRHSLATFSSMASTSLGRPRIVETPEEFTTRATTYFEECDRDDRKPTTYGLALALGFASRQSLWDYRQHPDFSYAVTRAISFIGVYHEENLFGAKPQGSMFWLKQDDWKDEKSMKMTGVLATFSGDGLQKLLQMLPNEWLSRITAGEDADLVISEWQQETGERVTKLLESGPDGGDQGSRSGEIVVEPDAGGVVLGRDADPGTTKAGPPEEESPAGPE